MPSFRTERRFHRAGLTHIAGVDEVGRGAWAGPLVAGAVILPPPDQQLRRAMCAVDDSKRLTPTERAVCAELILRVAVAAAVGVVPAAEIDTLGITRATQAAMRRAVANLAVMPAALLIDAFPLPGSPLRQRAIIRGDSYSYSIAAASIVAKVYRDALMCDLDGSYPGYGFRMHKGYGTAAHRQALHEFGCLPEHRHTFAPIAALLAREARGNGDLPP